MFVNVRNPFKICVNSGFVCQYTAISRERFVCFFTLIENIKTTLTKVMAHVCVIFVVVDLGGMVDFRRGTRGGDLGLMPRSRSRQSSRPRDTGEENIGQRPHFRDDGYPGQKLQGLLICCGAIIMVDYFLWGNQHVCQSTVGQSICLSIECGTINMFINLLWGNQQVCRSAVWQSTWLIIYCCQSTVGQLTCLSIYSGAVDMFVYLLWANQHVCQSSVRKSTCLTIYFGAIDKFVSLQCGNRHVGQSTVGQ